MVSNSKERYKVWSDGELESTATVIKTHSATMAAERFAEKDRGRVKDYEESPFVRIHVITPDGERYLFEVERVTYMAANELEGPEG
jgi:hypothetical protein